MQKLTARQQQVLDVIRDYIKETGYPPSRAQIAKDLGFNSVNAAVDHLKALQRKGYITIMPGISRGIRLTEDQHPAEGLPVVGSVAAGSPILAIEHIESHYAVDDSLFKPQADYLLHVKGMSMRDAGIVDGDLLAVHQTQCAQNGQIVIARIDDEVTVKVYQQNGQQVRLLAENPDFPNIMINPAKQSLVIEGIAVGVIRRNLGIPR